MANSPSALVEMPRSFPVAQFRGCADRDAGRTVLLDPFLVDGVPIGVHAEPIAAILQKVGGHVVPLFEFSPDQAALVLGAAPLQSADLAAEFIFQVQGEVRRFRREAEDADRLRHTAGRSARIRKVMGAMARLQRDLDGLSADDEWTLEEAAPVTRQHVDDLKCDLTRMAEALSRIGASRGRPCRHWEIEFVQRLARLFRTCCAEKDRAGGGTGPIAAPIMRLCAAVAVAAELDLKLTLKYLVRTALDRMRDADRRNGAEAAGAGTRME